MIIIPRLIFSTKKADSDSQGGGGESYNLMLYFLTVIKWIAP